MAGKKPKGAHRGRALTAATIKNLKEPGFYGDGEGLYLKVDTNGKQRWVQRIVIQGKRRDIGLGPFPRVSLAEAREAAWENRKHARQGRDPLAEKRSSQGILAFEQASRRIHERDALNWRNPKHAKQWLSTLEKYIFPFFGKKRMDLVTSADVREALDPIWQIRPETARRVRQRVNVVFEWAISNGWRQDNPVTAASRGLAKQVRTVKHMKSVSYTEVSKAIETVLSSEASQSTKLAMEFLILTATRSGETRGARWSEISTDKREWVIPAERMKAKRIHRVPLSERCIEILKEAESLRSEDSDLVFPGTVKGKPLSDMTLSKLLKELRIDSVPHGFRTSFKVWAEEQTNFPSRVSEEALAHVIKNKTEAAYARSDLFEKRQKLMTEWADYLISNKQILDNA
ncbi:tyrosine-type recombinase/integrase [Sphingosinicella sp.]|uniref:tyrosine-type recombinase/integrase n=1 Tax=Sphingosinicella sp. TaxID=1917971 RepID=UPI0035B2FCF9